MSSQLFFFLEYKKKKYTDLFPGAPKKGLSCFSFHACHGHVHEKASGLSSNALDEPETSLSVPERVS